jgi:hypothetical protein
MPTEIRIEHRYPDALTFLHRHGPDAVAVIHDLLAQSRNDDGQLVVQASVRQVAERLGLLSKDTVNRRMRALLSTGVLRRLVLDETTRFEAPTYVLNLSGTGIFLATPGDPRSA